MAKLSQDILSDMAHAWAASDFLLPLAIRGRDQATPLEVPADRIKGVVSLCLQFTRLAEKENRQRQGNSKRGGRPTGRKDSYQRTRPKRKTEKVS